MKMAAGDQIKRRTRQTAWLDVFSDCAPLARLRLANRKRIDGFTWPREASRSPSTPVGRGSTIFAELGQHVEVELALERHDQLRQPFGYDPFPGVEFGVLGGGRVDIAVRAGKAHREPFL